MKSSVKEPGEPTGPEEGGDIERKRERNIQRGGKRRANGEEKGEIETENRGS